MNDKLYLSQLEKHMITLSAPNYNLNIILKNCLYDRSIKHKKYKAYLSNSLTTISESVDEESQQKILKNTNSISSEKDNVKNIFQSDTNNKSFFPSKITNVNKENLDFNLLTLSSVINIKNHKRINKVISKEILNIEEINKENIKQISDTEARCNNIALEKIELYDDNELLDQELTSINKQKLDILKSVKTNSTDGNFTASTRETASSNSLVNKEIVSKKMKKIEELNEMLMNLQNSIKLAKENSELRKVHNLKISNENKYLKEQIEQKNIVLSHLKAEHSYMKNKVDEKKNNTSQSSLFSSIKNIFKKKSDFKK